MLPAELMGLNEKKFKQFNNLIKNKKFLELGAGSGIISFFASSEGAYVTASEIAEPALDGLYYNNKKLDANITIIESNLFDKLDQVYDIIIINPPYYPKEPKNDEEIAWFCGSNFEYFNKLFSSIHQVVDSNTQTYMILSEKVKKESHLSQFQKKIVLKF